MTEVRHYCDGCHRLIESDRAVLTLRCGPRPPGWPSDPATGLPAVELCGPCLAALLARLDAIGQGGGRRDGWQGVAGSGRPGARIDRGDR